VIRTEHGVARLYLALSFRGVDRRQELFDFHDAVRDERVVDVNGGLICGYTLGSDHVGDEGDVVAFSIAWRPVLSQQRFRLLLSLLYCRFIISREEQNSPAFQCLEDQARYGSVDHVTHQRHTRGWHTIERDLPALNPMTRGVNYLTGSAGDLDHPRRHRDEAGDPQWIHEKGGGDAETRLPAPRFQMDSITHLGDTRRLHKAVCRRSRQALPTPRRAYRRRW
jgi:hypothetical protein